MKLQVIFRNRWTKRTRGSPNAVHDTLAPSNCRNNNDILVFLASREPTPVLRCRESDGKIFPPMFVRTL